VREALFNIIAFDVHGAIFLDAYAGSGAVGLEALSRGAARAVFIERNPVALQVLRQNIALLGAGERSEIIAGDAAELTDLLRSRNLAPDLIFADPPYAGNAADSFLNALVHALHQAVVSPSRGIIIQMEDGWAALNVGTVALDFVKSKRYGRTELSFWTPLQPDDV
jgi:16S rRNA (guanine(966)-N(2))-methyltransferase RsmD